MENIRNLLDSSPETRRRRIILPAVADTQSQEDHLDGGGGGGGGGLPKLRVLVQRRARDPCGFLRVVCRSSVQSSPLKLELEEETRGGLQGRRGEGQPGEESLAPGESERRAGGGRGGLPKYRVPIQSRGSEAEQPSRRNGKWGKNKAASKRE
ncbi:hypothetical protein CesoFtcFv8_009667 [Champsocephalus esox]|nr:hypothetical protein CesoFtcFv8_009667 [Champsocephalus esox]